MSTNVVKFLYELAKTLADSMQDVYAWLTNEYTLFGQSFAVYELLFGGALVLVIGYGLVKYLLP